MADAIVSFAVERLGDLLISETKLLYGVSNQINEIRCELKRLQNFLKEADKKQFQDERVRGWVHEIKELAFRTEDAIEIFALQVATNSGFKEALRRFACISVQVRSRHNVAMEINDIKAKLTNIHQSLPTYGITKGLEEGETSSSRVNLKTQRISFPYDVEKDFIGMEKEIEQLISFLKKEDKGCELISIWGMGGQGKTTLAQKLYNHAVIRDHFKAFAWVCISQQFDWAKNPTKCYFRKFGVMDYWVAKVKVGQVFEVKIPVGKVLHLSHACLGEAQKGHSHIHLYVNSHDSSKKKNVLGSLNPKNLRNLSFNLSFSKSFKLSHNSKEGAVYFHGGFAAGNPTYSLHSGENAGVGFINKDEIEISNKRALESPSETTGYVKKPKVANPQIANGMDNDAHVDAPRPSKQDGKTPAYSLNQKISKRKGSYPCKQCTRTFHSNISVELHTKAKHA